MGPRSALRLVDTTWAWWRRLRCAMSWAMGPFRPLRLQLYRSARCSTGPRSRLAATSSLPLERYLVRLSDAPSSMWRTGNFGPSECSGKEGLDPIQCRPGRKSVWFTSGLTSGEGKRSRYSGHRALPRLYPSLLLRRRQAPHLGRFARSCILTGQASTPPVHSVVKHAIYGT